MIDLLREDFNDLWGNELPWEELNNKTVLVTGATGLIGTFLVYSLIDRNIRFFAGIRIVVLARNRDNLERKFGKYEKVCIIAQDVCKDINIDGTVDYIVHAACDVQPHKIKNNPVGVCETVIGGAKTVCKLAIRKSAKLICLSSLGIYGRMIELKPYDDTMAVYLPLNDYRYAYQESKRMAEMLCASYRYQYHLNYSLLRTGRVYGPTMNHSDSAVLSSFIINAVKGKDILLKSDGLQEYTYDYVEDVASSIYYLMFRGKCTGYNCGEGDEIEPEKFGDVIQIVADLNGIDIKRAVEENDDSKSLSVVYSRITSEKLMKIGWKKVNTIQQGLRKTCDIYRERLKNNL